eukprot:TRINITY_DN6492_c0_g1_i2.p2 TRINITY_DN6492_c0_g1~~TRINITY_DN6492_c0_g1_i2.p2  ORF type:complete len:166 (+),score=27.36 TRINITY_DN6492_c0_g1_i2:155-652(+)
MLLRHAHSARPETTPLTQPQAAMSVLLDHLLLSLTHQRAPPVLLDTCLPLVLHHAPCVLLVPSQVCPTQVLALHVLLEIIRPLGLHPASFVLLDTTPHLVLPCAIRVLLDSCHSEVLQFVPSAPKAVFRASPEVQSVPNVLTQQQHLALADQCVPFAKWDFTEIL